MDTEHQEIEKVLTDLDGIITFCALSEHKQLHLLGMLLAFVFNRIRKTWNK